MVGRSLSMEATDNIQSAALNKTLPMKADVRFGS